MKLLCVVDKYKQECLALHVARRIRAAEVIGVLAILIN